MLYAPPAELGRRPEIYREPFGAGPSLLVIIVLLDKFVPDGLQSVRHRPDECRPQQGSDHDGQARGDRQTLWAELPADAWLAAQIPPRSQRHRCEGETTSIEYRYVEGGSAG
jgi:hypothetical protein